MQIDIRKETETKITEIVFADGLDTNDARKLELEGEYTKIRSADHFVYLSTEEDALNLILALEKGIELGNWS